MSLSSTYKTELLAPAGSVEAFFGALEAGADAVYCGLKDFSARTKAKNFTIQEMANLCAYAHKAGRKLYVPLNTLIKDAELPKLINVLEGLASCHIDGLIIQDLGVYNLVHRFFPELPLHASTQMAVHNRAGVKMLERMGFERAVLARELSLDEIKAIRKDTTIELEHFIHGALCYSISGHCLFSSSQTGSSGNRGSCNQPCRRRYTQGKQPQFTFSTSDFSTLAHLPQLAKNGVMSFKIEGRMKNSEYVWNVVRAYREVLDCSETDIPQAIRRGETILQQSHGRQTTSGFLSTKKTSILLPNQKGGIGKPAGQVEQTGGKYISFTSQTTLHIGDKLRVQPQTDQPGISFTLRDIQVGKKRSQQAGQGQFITVQTPFFERFTPGDHIFKISSGRGFTLSEEACRRRLTTATLTPTEIDLIISCTPTALTVETTSPLRFKHTYEVETYPAQKSPLSLAALDNIFRKTGYPELQLQGIETNHLPPVVIKPSRLKAIRRDFYEKVSQELLVFTSQKTEKRLAAIQLERGDKSRGRNLQKPKLFVQSDQSHAEFQSQPFSLILPLATEAGPADHDLDCIWDIPAIIYDKKWQETQQWVEQKMALGYRKFRLNNIGHFILFAEAETLELMTGPALYCLNQQALQALKEMDIKHITTSVEDDKTNIKAICSQTNQAIIQVYGKTPLMTSRIPLAINGVITCQSQETLHAVQDGELTKIYAATPFSLSGSLHELQEMGAAGYLIDLRGHSAKERQAVLQSIRANQVITGSTPFNYHRGLI